jgi:hypothetical protein
VKTFEPVSSILLLKGLFLIFHAARPAAISAYQMVAVAVGWQTYELTHRALDLGFVEWIDVKTRACVHREYTSLLEFRDELIAADRKI